MRLDRATLYFGRNGRCMLLGVEGALLVSIDCNDTTWTGHLERQLGVMQDRIEAAKRGSSEQCVIAAAEGEGIED